MASAAERQRRHRAHRKGDHSLCDPARCDGDSVTPAVTLPAEPQKQTPPGLAGRGRRLWRETVQAGHLGPRERVLLEEACRIADRLDRLDAMLVGERGEWMRFQVSDDGTEVTVSIDKPLAEARAQAVALKQIMSELRQSGAKQPAQPEREASGLDDLARRRAARRAAAPQ